MVAVVDVILERLVWYAERNHRVPPRRLFQDGVYVRERVAVREVGETVWPYYSVQLRLGRFLRFGVRHDGQYEGQKSADCLMTSI